MFPLAKARTVVVGGGPAGVAAALACARMRGAGRRGEGPDVLLIEQHGYLGGCSTAGLVGPWMTFHARDGRQVVDGIPQEIVDRLVAAGGSPGHIRDALGVIYSFTPVEPTALKFVLDDMVKESGAEVLFHARFCGVETSGGRIEAVRVAHPGGVFDIRGEVFVDATGNGELAAMAGAPWEMGRSQDGLCQALTLIFRMSNVDAPRVKEYMKAHPEEFHHTTDLEILEKTGFLSCSGFFGVWRGGLDRGEVSIPRDRLLFFSTPRHGEILVNTTRVVKTNPLDPFELSRAELVAREQVRQLTEFLRRRVPGFEDSYLLDIASTIGVRESRRILGDHVLTAGDILAGRRFEDGVCMGAYPIDIHDPSGSGLVYREEPEGFLYSIPYRCLTAKNTENLLVVGRCISATHEATASVRVTATCLGMGQAAGVAASLAPHGRVREVDVAHLRERIRQLGGCIID
ncbi:MAG: FAD-dependent oxidoreductase [Firmicutes bacterium]|nr:FAD-dependent oxidoreductase [Bacillota bacterium]